MSYRRRRYRSVRGYKGKQIGKADLMKSVTNLRKSLLDAQKVAMLAVDELETNLYAAQANNDAIQAEIASDVDGTVEIVRAIQSAVTEALEMSEEAKAILTGDHAAIRERDMPVETPASRMRHYRRARRNRHTTPYRSAESSLRARRKAARRKRIKSLGL